MSYAAVRRSTDGHTVSSDSLPAQGARKAYWFKAAEVNNCRLSMGWGCVILQGAEVAMVAHAGKLCPSCISADRKHFLHFKAKFSVASRDSEILGSL